MDSKNFSVGEALSFGWAQLKSHFLFFAAILVVAGIVYFVGRGINTAIQRTEGSAVVFYLLMALVVWLVQVLIQLGTTRISLKIHDGQPAQFSDLFSGMPYFLNYLAASILYFLMCAVGLLLLVIPGIYLGMRFQFYGYFVVDLGSGPIEALKRSAKITEGSMLKLFLMAVILAAINFVGALLLLLGLFVTVPISVMAMAYVYRRLSSGTKASEIPVVTS